jgi:hypothetical protein
MLTLGQVANGIGKDMVQNSKVKEHCLANCLVTCCPLRELPMKQKEVLVHLDMIHLRIEPVILKRQKRKRDTYL